MLFDIYHRMILSYGLLVTEGGHRMNHWGAGNLFADINDIGYGWRN